jgi:hypothetical protein
MTKPKTKPLTSSRFSEFIRNASAEEKARVYAVVMDRVAAQQAEVVVRHAAQQTVLKKPTAG